MFPLHPGSFFVQIRAEEVPDFYAWKSEVQNLRVFRAKSVLPYDNGYHE